MRLQLKILFEINVFPISPGVALAYLQTGISGVFWGVLISKICIFFRTAHSCCIFGLLDKCCIFKCSAYLSVSVLFGSSFMHQVLQ